MFEPYLSRWQLLPDGEPIMTHGSRLLPVRRGAVPAMLKIALDDDEVIGNQLMTWWAGAGAAPVLAREGAALLMVRAEGGRSLLHMARHGEDDQASRLACACLARLHAPRPGPAPSLLPLARWFQALRPAAAREGGVLLESLAAADALLADPRDEVVLHGDAHHENILDFGEHGWLAIDPKRVRGERGFDFANLICNPQLPTATDPARFTRQVAVIAEAADLPRQRLLQWVLAYSGLSAAWFLEDRNQTGAGHQRQMARLAAEALAQP